MKDLFGLHKLLGRRLKYMLRSNQSVPNYLKIAFDGTNDAIELKNKLRKNFMPFIEY
jgi:hypothetical protein